MIGRGRPVLVATRTVRASEALGAHLAAAGIEHVILNAAQDEEEGRVIAEAGTPGQVTVATNMAGRGVDIPLREGADTRGGLHVILTERHEAGRIDRQVFGRCARLGDPGSCEAILSWADPILETFGGWEARWRLGGDRTFLKAQKRAERLHAAARLDLLQHDLNRDEHLQFAGTSE